MSNLTCIIGTIGPMAIWCTSNRYSKNCFLKFLGYTFEKPTIHNMGTI